MDERADGALPGSAGADSREVDGARELVEGRWVGRGGGGVESEKEPMAVVASEVKRFFVWAAVYEMLRLRVDSEWESDWRREVSLLELARATGGGGCMGELAAEAEAKCGGIAVVVVVKGATEATAEVESGDEAEAASGCWVKVEEEKESIYQDQPKREVGGENGKMEEGGIRI